MSQRLTYIDVARGLAVSLVVFQHVVEQIMLANASSPMTGLLNHAFGFYTNLGRLGVVLFFFVSGFVIPNSFPNTERPIRDFAVNRFLRLYPMYWLSVLLAVLVLPRFAGASFSWTQILANLTMFQSFVGIESLRIAYWTLAIELLFYMICAGLFWLGLLQWRLNAVVLVVALSLGGVAVLLATDARGISRLAEIGLNLSAMFLGKSIREHYLEKRLAAPLLCLAMSTYALFALVLSWDRYSGPYDPETFFSAYSMASSYLGALLLFILLNRYAARWTSPTLAFIGTVSYSVYLMHAYVLAIYVDLVGIGATPALWLLGLAAISAVSIFISWLCYEVIEKRCILAGRRLRSRRVAPAPGRDDRVPV